MATITALCGRCWSPWVLASRPYGGDACYPLHLFPPSRPVRRCWLLWVHASRPYGRCMLPSSLVVATITALLGDAGRAGCMHHGLIGDACCPFSGCGHHHGLAWAMLVSLGACITALYRRCMLPSLAHVLLHEARWQRPNLYHDVQRDLQAMP